jgi:hypothetical protein
MSVSESNDDDDDDDESDEEAVDVTSISFEFNIELDAGGRMCLSILPLSFRNLAPFFNFL